MDSDDSDGRLLRRVVMAVANIILAIKSIWTRRGQSAGSARKPAARRRSRPAAGKSNKNQAGKRPRGAPKRKRRRKH